MSVIAFIGSVFSPYYAWSGRRDPHDHVCINVALYGSPARWAMTERGRASLTQSDTTFRVGPSQLSWKGDTLVIDVDEITSPLPSRLRGQIHLTPHAHQKQWFAVHSNDRHHWWPYAPAGRIEVNFKQPNLAWVGHGYADANTGTAALEDDFSGWTWLRVATPNGAFIVYEPTERTGTRSAQAFEVSNDGTLTSAGLPPVVDLRPGFWGVKRLTRSHDARVTQITQGFVDAPFYTRDALQVSIAGEPCAAVHESLDLDRFKNPIVKCMLPVKMPRRTGWR